LQVNTQYSSFTTTRGDRDDNDCGEVELDDGRDDEKHSRASMLQERI
jgi:hypothetical protein